jgi:transcriptional regulator with XRE-family HTH domain
MTTGTTSSSTPSGFGAPVAGETEVADPKHPYVQYLLAAMARENLIPYHLAQKSGVSRTTISLILNGKSSPEMITNPVHEAFAHALSVPMARLVQLAGYDLYEGVDVPYIETLAQVGTLVFPPMRTLADVAALPDAQLRTLMTLLARRSSG